MAGAGEEINSAFLEGLTPDQASIESRLQNIRLLRLYDPEEAKRQGADNAMAYLTSLGDALDSYEKAKVEYLAEPDNEYAKAEFDRALGNLRAIADQNPIIAKVDVDTSLFGTKMENLAGSVDLKKLISDPEEFKEKVMDIPAFVENTFQPALADEINFMVDQWDSGYGEARKQTEDFVDALASASEKMPDLFSSAQLARLDKYKNGLIDAGEALKGLSYDANSVADSIERINFAQNAAAGSYEDLMFYGSYIGPTSGYYDWLVEESGKPEDQIRTFLINADCAEADAALEKLDAKATSTKTAKLNLDTTEAEKDVLAFNSLASKPITKSIYIDYIDGGYDGGYDSGDWYSGGISGSSTWQDVMWPYAYQVPFFGSGDVFVRQPTLAVVGDRPGGEWIGGIDQAKARFGGAGTSQISIKIEQNINGTGLSVDELSRVLSKNNEEIYREVADRIQTGKAF